MDNCLHTKIYDNICVDCGSVLGSTELISYATHAVPVKLNNLNYKYTISNTSYYTREGIRNILALFNKQNYEDEIFNIINTKKYKNRMSTTEKILITVYYVLKQNDVPVIPIDIIKMYKKGAQAFYKAMFTEFNYVRNSCKYTTNVIDRILDYLKAKEYKIEERVIKEKISKQTGACLDIVNVALYCIFEEENEIMWELTDKKAYRKTVNRLQVKNRNKKRNTKLKLRIDNAIKRLSSKDIDNTKIDELDLYIEKLLLKGQIVNKLKQMTMQEIRKKMHNDACNL